MKIPVSKNLIKFPSGHSFDLRSILPASTLILIEKPHFMGNALLETGISSKKTEQFRGVYFGLCQTSRMELLAKLIKGFWPLTFFAKSAMKDIWQGLKWASAVIFYYRKPFWRNYAHLNLLKVHLVNLTKSNNAAGMSKQTQA